MLHSNITSKRERNPLYLVELEEPLRNHPHTRFIWAHAGTSMELHRHQEKLEFLHETVSRLLDDYPNLYIDLSWTMLKPYLLGEGDKPDPKWVELVTRHPTRFVIGSDVVGHFENLATGMNAFAPFSMPCPRRWRGVWHVTTSSRCCRKTPGRAALSVMRL